MLQELARLIGYRLRPGVAAAGTSRSTVFAFTTLIGVPTGRVQLADPRRWGVLGNAVPPLFMQAIATHSAFSHS